MDFRAQRILCCLLVVRQKKKKIPLSTLEEVDMDLCDTELVVTILTFGFSFFFISLTCFCCAFYLIVFFILLSLRPDSVVMPNS